VHSRAFFLSLSSFSLASLLSLFLRPHSITQPWTRTTWPSCSRRARFVRATPDDGRGQEMSDRERSEARHTSHLVFFGCSSACFFFRVVFSSLPSFLPIPFFHPLTSHHSRHRKGQGRHRRAPEELLLAPRVSSPPHRDRRLPQRCRHQAARVHSGRSRPEALVQDPCPPEGHCPQAPAGERRQRPLGQWPPLQVPPPGARHVARPRLRG
jgi:hypothetical protein